MSFARRQGRSTARSPSSTGRVTHASTTVGSGISATISGVNEFSDSNSSAQSDSSFRTSYAHRLSWERDMEDNGPDSASSLTHEARLSPAARQVVESSRSMRTSRRSHSSRGGSCPPLANIKNVLKYSDLHSPLCRCHGFSRVCTLAYCSTIHSCPLCSAGKSSLILMNQRKWRCRCYSTLFCRSSTY
jgi:hypothetical protein